ncbi:hypothetical protein [Neisseria lactamica]|uniref:hypothetical protein n=1 Tax=Neisseria lactamica TaxID=486 RepID=UPI0012900EC4|nr:hypothetical protein [Neisseria lactamica]
MPSEGLSDGMKKSPKNRAFVLKMLASYGRLPCNCTCRLNKNRQVKRQPAIPLKALSKETDHD